MLRRVQGRLSIQGAALILGCLALLAGSARPSARAEEDDDESRAALRLIESTERNLDPLGLDEATGQGLDEAARAIKAPKPVAPTAEPGDVLTAIDGVFESAHTLNIKLEAGLAFIDERIVLSNRTRHAAEVAYRLRVPRESAVSGFEVCVDGRCRPAQRASAATTPTSLTDAANSELPSASLSMIREGEQRALALLVRPVRERAVTLHISYVTLAPLHGGRVRLTLPARGFDPRVVPANVQVEGKDLSDLSPASSLTSEPSLPLEISGIWQPKHARYRMSSQCQGVPCSREFQGSAVEPLSARNTWLLIDASPSMEGVARSRVPGVLAALLTQLPETTQVRAFAFGADAGDLGTFSAIEAPLSKWSDAVLEDHGAATHVSSVLARWHEALARERPRVIVISDGALDPNAHERAALERARRAGAELALIALADQAPYGRALDPFSESGGIVHMTELADRALTRGELDALSEHLNVLLAARHGRASRAGEGLVLERRQPAKAHGSDREDWLPAWLARNESAPSFVAAAPARAEAIAAPPFVDVPPPAPRASTGMPKESVLDFLRTQLVPQARACLRADRRGRADYAVGLTFQFLIARREVSDASIEGAAAGPLRECLLAVLPRLRLPWFTGTLRVRYPIHTEREAEPPVIELEPEVAREVDRVIGAPPRHRAP